VSAGLAKRLLLAAAALHLSACSSEATIRRRDGALVDARIVASDPDALFLAGPAGPTRLPRADVDDIDHPGNVLVVAGLSVLLVGAQIIASEHQTGAGAASVAVTTGLPGLAMITWGATTYLRSNGAAARFQNETMRLTTPDPNRPYLPAPTWRSLAPPR